MDSFQNSYLNNLLPKEKALFESKKTLVTYLKGETIIKQGAFASSILFVNNGLVKNYIQSTGPKLINLRLIKSGNFLAFFSLFGPNVYPFSALALRDTEVCMIDRNAFIELMLQNPQFALEITSKNYRMEHRYLELISSLTFKQMRGKLATALLYLSSDYYADTDLFEYLTRQDIADFASITLESTIKFIKEFEKDGILSLDGKKIVVEQRDKLEGISRIG